MAMTKDAIVVTDFEENWYYDGDDMYIAQAQPGNTDSSLPYWRVKKIKNNATGTPNGTRWGNGDNSFHQIADNYLTLTYANEN